MGGVTGVLRILIMDGLIPFGVRALCVFGLRVSSAVYQFVAGRFVLVSSVRPSGVPYGG